ncbi:MAG: hypothetical protein C4320_00360 [Armatimonadota bacterium]
MKTSASLAALLLVTGALIAPAALAPQTSAPTKDIVATAMGDARFSTLVTLVKKAGLVSTLQGAGPFTVLAPTNDAFAKVPKPLLEKLSNDPALLKKVLTYHVISGKILAADLKTMSATTVEGEAIRVKLGKKGPRFNSARVVAADILTTNGVIHAIDTMLIPPSIKPASGPRQPRVAPTAPNTGTTGGGF